MKLFNLIESVSSIVYHYTTVPNALNILTTGHFHLSSTIGSVEQQYAPEGSPFFLSTTRTRRGGYHDIIGSSAVLFVLDGTWFNRRYKGAPVDYWLNRSPTELHHRSHEAEDRIFSPKPTIPIDGVMGIHIYVSPDADEPIKARARKLMIQAKLQGIQAFLYNDKSAWRQLDTRKKGQLNSLKGQESSRSYTSRHKGYLIPWVELLHSDSQTQLSKRANEIRYGLKYYYDKQQIARGLGNDFSNARKPDSGPDRRHALTIIKFMQDNKLKNLNDFVNYLADKWENKNAK